ncbi:hypothetical protein GUITHDRAFT_103069 [Guillardia theta CCMP2712]|uniref:Uncharacterized protein n=1 Tax=Guillardia theta (strain CCMP2712) TaxID=905079 RepID=L1JS59_GUITC|nr:hypothetical protein GUITHDRAFT_103069 [Guillardia theta CCMP2712]EKX51149.1 hypothetical protein GUITHDRAFT_103069 [Guillardia theta CCMP2712]|eukprot:XP_005838129.1 hypothetical protein GUITHDRAFT_103069 [Guillardia theta CCMP2712]
MAKDDQAIAAIQDAGKTLWEILDAVISAPGMAATGFNKGVQAVPLPGHGAKLPNPCLEAAKLLSDHIDELPKSGFVQVIASDGDERKGSISSQGSRRLSKSIKELIEQTDAVIASSKTPMYVDRKSNSSTEKGKATEEEKNELLSKVMKKIQDKTEKSKDVAEDMGLQELIDKTPLALLLPKPPKEESKPDIATEALAEQARRSTGLQAKLKGIVQGVRERAGSEEKESTI